MAPVANLCLTSHQGWRHKLQQQKSKTQDNKRTQLANFFFQFEQNRPISTSVSSKTQVQSACQRRDRQQSTRNQTMNEFRLKKLQR